MSFPVMRGAVNGLGSALVTAGALCIALLGGCATVEGSGEPEKNRFEFGLVGDQQYNPESEAKFPRIMEQMNRSNLAFVVHVGDFKGEPPACSDALFQQRKEEFNASKHPLIYTPGDNDWTDCHRSKPPSDPLERLTKLREMFFEGNRSLGQRSLTLVRQGDDPQHAKYRENARWTFGNVLFATIHLVGSNNNLGRTAEADAEFRERNDANLAWIRQAFDTAKREGNAAVVLFTQANPIFEDWLPKRRVGLLRVAPPSRKPSGFTDIVALLEREALAFKGPVVLMHGDTHYFRVDKPLFRTGEAGPANFGRQIENFTRVETFGMPEAHWVRVIVDLKDPHVFIFKEQVVDGNRFRKP